MTKKYSTILLGLCTILNTFQVQADSDNATAAAGAGLFAFAATAMTVRSWNQSHEKQVATENQAATEIERIVRGNQTRQKQKKQHLSATEIQKIARGYSDRQSFKKEKYKKTRDLVTPKIERKYQLNELETLMRLDDTTKVDHFFNKHFTVTTNFSTDTSVKNIKDNAQNNVEISTKHTISQKNQNENEPKKLIVWPIIHGTGATDSTSFGNNLNHPTTQAIIRQGQYKAFKENADVKLLVTKWNGIWKKDARIKSGKKIGQLVTEEMLKNPEVLQHFYFTGHSYGCDVGREATKEIDRIVQNEASPETRDNICLKYAYCLASPPTKVDISHLMKEIHMYGDNDAVATAEAYRLSKHTSTDIHNPFAHINIRFPNDDHSTIKYNGIRYLHEVENITKTYPGETTFIVDISPGISTTSDSSSDEDGFYEAKPQPETPYKVINLIDMSHRNKNTPLDKALQEQQAQAHGEYQHKYPDNDPYAKKSFTNALDKEAETRGYKNNPVGKVMVDAIVYSVGGLEYILGGSPKNNRVSPPSTTTPPLPSPTNSSDYTTPPSTSPENATEAAALEK